MENTKKQTLKEKLWDKGKWFIPFYGAKGWPIYSVHMRIKGKGPKYTANALYTTVLGVMLVAYSMVGFYTGNFNPKEQWSIIKQREQKAKYKSTLRSEFVRQTDTDKNGVYALNELKDIYERAENLGIKDKGVRVSPGNIVSLFSLEELERLVQNYEIKNKK